MSKIYAPNRQYTGVTASVNFVNGVGETEDVYLLAYFAEKGYSVGESFPDEEGTLGTDEPENTPDGDIDTMLGLDEPENTPAKETKKGAK